MIPKIVLSVNPLLKVFLGASVLRNKILSSNYQVVQWFSALAAMAYAIYKDLGFKFHQCSLSSAKPFSTHKSNLNANICATWHHKKNWPLVIILLHHNTEHATKKVYTKRHNTFFTLLIDSQTWSLVSHSSISSQFNSSALRLYPLGHWHISVPLIT